MRSDRNENIHFSNRAKYLLTGLLIILNFVIRVPSVPHEIGNDGFTIHILANSVSAFGHAKWWAHPASIFGFYPYSYASAVPFLLSGISQCSGVNMETTIWIFCVIIGVFSAFTAYLLAKEIWNNDAFKFIVAFTYSLSPGILTFSTWDVSTRGLFIILLPLFIYLLLKIRSYIKFGILFIVLFILLTATHHYIFMTIPIILGFTIFIVINKIISKSMQIRQIRISHNCINVIFILTFMCMFLIPFFTRIFGVYSRYVWLHLMFENYVRYAGIITIFAISGYVYLSLKYNKNFNEWSFLFFTLFLAPLLYVLTYAHYFTIIFVSILASISLANITNMIKDGPRKKCAFFMIVIILLLSISFSGFYQHWRTHKGKATAGEWYMSEKTYTAALWIRENIDENKRLVCNNDLTCRRMLAISEVPTLVGAANDCMLTYGFTEVGNIKNVTMNSPLTTRFYLDNPYVMGYPPHDVGASFFALQSWDIESWEGKRIISRFNLSYAIEDKYGYRKAFIQSLHEKRDNIYNNGKIRIWCLS